MFRGFGHNRCKIVDNKTGCATRLSDASKDTPRWHIVSETYTVPFCMRRKSETMIYDFYYIELGDFFFLQNLRHEFASPFGDGKIAYNGRGVN